MASGGNQGRMVFDIRGRRKTAVKVVYAVLAVLMGASLFLVVGPVNIGELFNSGGGASSATGQFESEAEKAERKLKANPEDPDLLFALTRARVNAGNSLSVVSPETGETASTTEGRQQYQLASDAWSRYLKATDEPSSGLAQLVAPIFLALAPASRSVPEAEANLDAAVEAEQIIADQRPTVNSLSTLAIYQLFSFEYKAAEKSEKEALALAHGKSEQAAIEAKLASIRKRAGVLKAGFETAEKEAAKAQGGSGGAGLGSSLGGAGLGE